MAKRVNKRFLIILTVVVAVGAVAGMAATYAMQRLVKKDPQVYVRESKAAEEAGNVDEAVAAYQFAVGADQDDPALRVALGDLYYRHVDADPQHFGKAHQAWESALAVDPTHRPAMERVLNSHWEYMKVAPGAATYKVVRQAAERILAADPQDATAQARINIVTIREAQAKMKSSPADVRKAVESLRALSKREPANADLVLWAAQGEMFLAGEAVARLTDVSDAREIVERLERETSAALKGQEDNAAMQLRVAQVLTQIAALEGQIANVTGGSGAGAAADGASTRPVARGKLPPGRPAGRFTDRVTEGLAAARQHAKPTDEIFSDVYVTSYEWHRALGKFDEAKAFIEELAKERGEEPAVRLQYARVFKSDPAKRQQIIDRLSRDVKVAGAQGVEALRLRDMEAGLKIELANLRLAGVDGGTDKAQRDKVVAEVEEQIKKLELIAGATAVPILEIKGRLAYLQGGGNPAKRVEAITLLQQAVDRTPDNRPNYETMLLLANAYLVNGQTGQAEKLLRQIVERVPDFAQGRVNWIQVLHSNGQFDEAREALAQLKKDHPKVKEIPALEALVEGGDKRETYVENMPEGTPVERLRKAVVLRADGKLDEAIALALSALKEDPKFLAALEQLLSMYMQAGRRDEALAAVQEAIKHNPDNKQLAALPDRLAQRTPEEFEQYQLERIKQEKDPVSRALALHAFYLQKANAAAQARDGAAHKAHSAEAEKYLAEAEAANPNDQRVMGTRFEFLLNQRRFDEAAGVQKKLAAMNADEANGDLLRFRLASAKGDAGAAEAAARDMTRSRPQFALGWQLLGQALQAEGRHREALSAYASALERQGRNYDALKGTVEAHAALGDPGEAKQVLDRARTLFPNDVALRELALKHEMTHGDPAKVVAERERLLKVQPDVPNNALALAETYLQTLADTQDPEKIKDVVAKARKVLEEGMKKWPNDARFQWPLAQVLLAQGDFLGGEKVLKAYGERPDIKDKAAVDLLMAEYYGRANKPAMAEQSMRDALAKTGDAPGIKVQLASLLAATGRGEEALKLLEGVAGPGPARQRVQLLLAANKLDEADKAIAEAIAANPNSDQLSNLLLDIHINRGRFAEAEQVVRDRLARNDADETARYYGALVKLRKSPPDPAGAVKDLTVLVDRNPRAANVLTLLADAYAAAGEQSGAIETLDRALQLQPNNNVVRTRLVQWCMQARRWDAVIKIASEAAASHRTGNDPTWPRALAAAYAAKGQFPEAEKQIARAHKLTAPEQLPELEREHLGILNQAKNYKRIIQLTDGWLAKGRKDWWLYQYRGNAKAALKDKAGAAKDFDTALAGLKPNEQFGAAQAIVRTIAQASGVDEALKRIEKWEAQDPRWRIVAAELCLTKDDAAAGVEHLLPLAPDADKLPTDLRAQFYRTLGQCYHTARPRSDVAKAAEAYKKYLEINPTDVLALNNLAYVLAEEIQPPQPTEAKVYSQKAYDIARDWKAGEGKSRILDTHGWVLVLNGGGDVDNGIRILEEVVDESPILEAHYHLGEAQLLKKRGDEAVEQLNLAVAMIEKAKNDKTTYDTTLEPRIARALTAAKALGAAAGAR